MNLKKVSLLFLFLALFILSGCGSKKVDMNVLDKDDKYHYENNNLGFSITLPKDFEYYQTQSKKTDEFNSLEIYVPTSDVNYGQAVSGYAKPVEIRVYKKSVWDNIKDKPRSKEIGIKGDKIYILIYWDRIPEEWRAKWTAEMENTIKDSIKIK